ncbi:hypothetical protein QDR37_07615 [Amnibacterium sp. CER49]|uniref:hypothetical protein n=1 Tax=Amnibacterium sp. CER49 TaxID=3039161 RepID=UPI00244CA24C|nr:hypothetical protein [Amnibacterium sp. CER49]MDH2443805.1 hypothetical protein [Amnibacterium sp. CER49]
MASRGTQALHVGLGAFSLALGAAPLVAPRAVARVAGLSTRPPVRGVLRAVGVRELAVGTGLLATRRPAWLWARVAQDVIDVPLASVTTVRKSGGERARMARVTAFLVAVTAADVAAAIRATRSATGAHSEERRRQMVFKAAVTIRLEEAEVRSRLPEADPPLSTEATVTFAPAPGGRGTEVRAVLDKGSGGPVGKAVGAVTGTDPGRQLSDAIRRFKQVLETGEVVRSEGSPEGTSAPRTRKQRSAEPVGAKS